VEEQKRVYVESSAICIRFWRPRKKHPKSRSNRVRAAAAVDLGIFALHLTKSGLLTTRPVRPLDASSVRVHPEIMILGDRLAALAQRSDHVADVSNVEFMDASLALARI